MPLSALGERQSFALGQWFASQPENARPDVVMTSPYLRAQFTGKLIRKAGGFALAQDQAFVVDERLREKEFGILDRLTRAGMSCILSRPNSAAFLASSITVRREVRAGAM